MAAIGQIKATSLSNYATGYSNSATVGFDTTFSPDGRDAKGVLYWVNRASGIQVGFDRLSMFFRKPTKDSRMTKVTVKFSMPTLEVTAPTTVTGIQPAPTKAYEHSFTGEFMLPERGTQAERDKFFSLVHSLWVNAIAANDASPIDNTGSPLPAAIISLDQPYS